MTPMANRHQREHDLALQEADNHPAEAYCQTII
jgi:hypothetical protein